jgi:hypothetical protein
VWNCAICRRDVSWRDSYGTDDQTTTGEGGDSGPTGFRTGVGRYGDCKHFSPLELNSSLAFITLSVQNLNKGLPITRRLSDPATSSSGAGTPEIPLQSMVSALQDQAIEWIKRTPHSKIRLEGQDLKRVKASANYLLRDRLVRLKMDLIFEVEPVEEVCLLVF